MDQIVIRGGKPLKGEIRISGAKNAALPLMAASLLTEETLALSNVPHLADIATMARLLAQHGVNLHMNGGVKNGSNGGVLDLQAAEITSVVAPYDLVRKMRASVLVLGPILAREGRAQVSLPGGCAIGTRPVDLHLNGLERLGAEIELKEGYIYASAPKGLVGASVVFPKVSVGATENLLMAACLAKGETQLVNAAREPEVIDLGDCLIKMGAEIEGLGSDRITVRGVDRLHGASHSVVADRIETGTYAMAAAITDGELDLIGGRADHLSAVIKVLTEAGIVVQETNRGLKVQRANGRVQGVDVMTEPYPGFPTDLQAQTMALMSTAEGASMITESIFENRFMHVPELSRMGASVNVHGASALVRGQETLTGAEVMATDLRASVSLVLAGLAAEGETVLNRVYHLDRGYECLEQKLAACGADIARRQAPR
ncbi:UDP-N-acetylglucosamine 1-carboxyvinyltransferase [Pelagibius sp.]|uniref:UDP-N-acetylglucosamine 1-carboxyvinyltransferase n=1 Tax=Pelagibius sp. TaxID=1931238 RepID=UPI003BB11E5D